MTYLKDIDIHLRGEEKSLICACVNRFGEGAHPYVVDTNIQHLGVEYVKECMEKAIPHLGARMTSDPKAIARDIIRRLG